jgi:diphthine-ammonia ligase
MEKAFVSWSGGKDCCQAAYIALRQGFQISCLFNMVNPEVGRSCSHGIATKWISLQSQAMGIPVIQEATTGDDYESIFVAGLKRLKEEGITTGVFGDIDFMPHLEWIENVCFRAGIRPLLPLWGRDQAKIARDFIDSGFKSILVAARADLLGEQWLGRTIDDAFLKDLENFNPGITPCGEAGEFHSLVTDGPMFKKSIEIKEASSIRRMDHWFLDIRRCDLVDK